MITKTAIDAFVRQDRADDNFGDDTILRVRGAGTSVQRRSFIHFARPFPLGVTILEATLRVYHSGTWSGTTTLTATRVTQSWKESRITWQNQPTIDAAEAEDDVLAGGANGTERAFDVQAMMQAVADGASWFGFRLAVDLDTLYTLHSAEAANADMRPTLEVVWVDAPQAPTGLRPSDGRSVTPTKPVLTWDAGEDEQAESHIEISTIDDFTGALSYDSGEVANTLPFWDMALTGWSGIASGQDRYWRVRVANTAGVWSEWSESAHFTREPPGSLSITNPGVGGTVEETTPPIDWTFTGQESYRVILQEVVAGGGTLLDRYDSGRIVSAATVHTLPAGVLNTGRTYRVTVQVWDDFDREVTAGEVIYVEATRDFTYARSGTPTAVTSLVADTTPGEPQVSLEWVRAAQPDWFALVVDGVIVLDRIDPAEVKVGATTTYTMEYWGAIPREAHTYEIEAVVLDAGVLKHSDGNATDTATTVPIGIWIADPTDSSAVQLLDQENADLGIGEMATVYFPIGGRAPVKITQGIRGYEGGVSGTLVGPTAQADRDLLLEIKGRMTSVRLILSDLNLPVILGEVVVAPTPQVDEYAVSVPVWQIDEFFEATGV